MANDLSQKLGEASLSKFNPNDSKSTGDLNLLDISDFKGHGGGHKSGGGLKTGGESQADNYDVFKKMDSPYQRTDLQKRSSLDQPISDEEGISFETAMELTIGAMTMGDPFAAAASTGAAVGAAAGDYLNQQKF